MTNRRNHVLVATVAAAAALAVAAAHRPVRLPPSDLRDAVADPSALQQLGGTEAAAPYIPEPAAAPPSGAGSPGSGVFAKDDIMELLASTGAGGDLLGHFERGEAELPEFVQRGQLTGADAEAARGAGISHEENRVALFIKGGKFRNNRPHIILYRSDWPLSATACIVAHELQHAVDQGAPWYRRLSHMREGAAAKLAKANSRGYLLLEDLALEDLGYGLGYMRTFFTEYLAYSRSSAVFRELIKKDPEAESRFAKFRNPQNGGKSIVERDPLNDPRDRREFMDAYFWPGNRARFKAGVEAVLKNEELTAELRAAGLETAISELAAFYGSPDPVYAPARALR